MNSAEFHGAKIINAPPDWESETVPCAPLFVEFTTIAELPVMKSVWVPSAQERAAIAAGANIALLIVGVRHPPVDVSLANVEVILDDNPFGNWKER